MKHYVTINMLIIWSNASHSKFHIIVYLYYISGKIAFIDEVDHCTECHTCYEYQSKQCGKCGSSWAQFCPKCNNTSRTMCEICGLDVSSWDSWTHSIEDCSVHSISQLDIQVKILHFFPVKMQENLIVIITNKRKATCNFYLFIYLGNRWYWISINRIFYCGRCIWFWERHFFFHCYYWKLEKFRYTGLPIIDHRHLDNNEKNLEY